MQLTFQLGFTPVFPPNIVFSSKINMKIFISSLITDMKEFRAAARSAVSALRHEPIMAEDFGAQPNSPQVACLQGIRTADMVVLILGERYGFVQGTSGLSPTHEEFMEARGTKPILMFVQEAVTRDAEQAAFVSEVQGWQHGYFRAGFETANELRDLVTRAVHDYQLANAAAPLDLMTLTKGAVSLLPAKQRNGSSGPPMLNVAIVGGPVQKVLRAAELEAPALKADLLQQALFGNGGVFVTSKGTESRIDQGMLCLEQNGGASIRVNEHGSLLLRLPVEATKNGRQTGFAGMFALIEEDVMRQIDSALEYAEWFYERLDPTQRLSHIVLAASIDAHEHLGWRTQAQQDASPNSGTVRVAPSERDTPVHIDIPRAALRFDRITLAEDLMVPLRRQRSS
jgi:hypothetical protein